MIEFHGVSSDPLPSTWQHPSPWPHYPVFEDVSGTWSNEEAKAEGFNLFGLAPSSVIPEPAQAATREAAWGGGEAKGTAMPSDAAEYSDGAAVLEGVKGNNSVMDLEMSAEVVGGSYVLLGRGRGRQSEPSDGQSALSESWGSGRSPSGWMIEGVEGARGPRVGEVSEAGEGLPRAARSSGIGFVSQGPWNSRKRLPLVQSPKRIRSLVRSAGGSVSSIGWDFKATGSDSTDSFHLAHSGGGGGGGASSSPRPAASNEAEESSGEAGSGPPVGAGSCGQKLDAIPGRALQVSIADVKVAKGVLVMCVNVYLCICVFGFSCCGKSGCKALTCTKFAPSFKLERASCCCAWRSPPMKLRMKGMSLCFCMALVSSSEVLVVGETPLPRLKTCNAPGIAPT